MPSSAHPFERAATAGPSATGTLLASSRNTKLSSGLVSKGVDAQLETGSTAQTENEPAQVIVTAASGGDLTDMERGQAAQLVFDNRDLSGIPFPLEDLIAKMADAPLIVLAKLKTRVVGVMALKNKVGTTYQMSEAGWFVVDASLRGSDVAKRLGAAFREAVKDTGISAIYGDTLVTNWSSLRTQHRTNGGRLRVVGYFAEEASGGSLVCLLHPFPDVEYKDGVLETCCEELVAHLCLHDYKHAPFSASLSLDQLRVELTKAPKERYGRTTFDEALKDICQWLHIESACEDNAIELV